MRGNKELHGKDQLIMRTCKKKVDRHHKDMKIRCTKKVKDHRAGKGVEAKVGQEKRMGMSEGWSRGGACTMR